MTLKTLAYLPIFTLASGALAQTLANQGLVGFASLPADSVDFLGDTVCHVLFTTSIPYMLMCACMTSSEVSARQQLSSLVPSERMPMAHIVADSSEDLIEVSTLYNSQVWASG